MSDIVIQAEGLSKLYRLGQRAPYKTLRESVINAMHMLFRRLSPTAFRSFSNGDQRRMKANELLWALKDISFEVRRGEVVGIIGQNGAGKSTLLKLLSRITEPTEGCAEIHGRVGSLLEVGTGFHPELTGRENIYLNGAILGMKKAEIKRRFDEIVAFSEIEKFIDTPVKRYSSGMYMRLAFAVAAHLEPEILLVDEVLAVGDAAFQKKCLGKMDDVAKEGRTVIFVSHNLLAMQSLCNRVVWLHNGQIVGEGESSSVVSNYLQTSFSTRTEQAWEEMATAPGNDDVRLHRACVRPASSSPLDPITVRTPFVVEFDYWNLNPDMCLKLSFQLYNEEGILVFDVGPTYEPIWRGAASSTVLLRDTCYVPGDLLNDGMHRIMLHITTDQGTLIHQENDILVFDIRDVTETRGAAYGKWPGAVRPMLEWDTELVDQVSHT